METARRAALLEAADFAEFYGNERLVMAGDSILHDPILAGGRFTRANMARSEEATIDGCINSAAYHASMHIAEHLRKLART